MINSVVFIGNDSSILTGVNGDARERMRLIASHFEKLTIIIFTLKEDRLKPLQEKNLEIIPTNSSNRWHFVFDSLKIISKYHDVDLISTQDPFIAGLVGVLAKRFFKIKLNIQIHNDFFGSPYFRKENLQNYIFYWLGKVNIVFADSIRVVSQRLKRWPNAFVAPVAADLDFFWAPPHTKIHNQIVCVARLAKQKNLPLLFDAAKLFPNLKFVVIGEGEERKKLENNLPGNVSLVGQKSRQEVKNIFSQSDIFVLTSNYEGWGISVIEALTAGLPVVMTDTGCAGEIIINNKSGFVVPVEQVKKLCSSIQRVYADRQMANEFVTYGQEILKNKYSQIDTMRRFVNNL